MIINPIVGVYIPIIRIPIKGGMTIPNIATFDRGTYSLWFQVWNLDRWSFQWVLTPNCEDCFCMSSGEDWRVTYNHWVVVSNIFYFHPYLGKWSNLANIFQIGWNHHLDQFQPTASILPHLFSQRFLLLKTRKNHCLRKHLFLTKTLTLCKRKALICKAKLQIVAIDCSKCYMFSFMFNSNTVVVGHILMEMEVSESIHSHCRE